MAFVKCGEKRIICYTSLGKKEQAQLLYKYIIGGKK